MRVPYRKPGKFSQIKNDPLMTSAKFDELKKKLEHLKKIRPDAAAEVARLAELGDFSENAEYQLAKGRLRGINNNILKLESELNQAEIITPRDNRRIEVGHTVTVEVNGKRKNFKILGSSETNPEKGIISYQSPIGAALMGRAVGEEISVKLSGKEVVYKIISIV